MGPVIGVVRTWHEDDGWGVLDSQHTPGGCWCHFSSLAVEGTFKTIPVGAGVEFLFELGEQDGYAFRAVEVWVHGRRVPLDEPEFGTFSTMTIRMDAAAPDGP